MKTVFLFILFISNIAWGNSMFLWMDSNNTLYLKSKTVKDKFDIINGGRIIGHEIESILKTQGEVTYKIKLNKLINDSRNTYLKFKTSTEKLFAYPNINMIKDHFTYDGNDLGIKEINGNIQAKLWSPMAEKVEMLVYKDGELIDVIELYRKDQGIFQTILDGSYKGLSYQYRVSAFDKTQIALDPYAKVMEAFTPKTKDRVGKGVLIDISYDQEYRPIKNLDNELGFVGYEVHLRDLTSDPSSNISSDLRGTFKGAEKKLDYLQDLGVSHLQILPIQNYYTVDENDKSFQDDKVLKRKINYNWGYDPHNYFTPEGHLSTRADFPTQRIREFKSFVEKAHDKGIGVILDVVYNHLYNQETLEAASPGAYMRRDHWGVVSMKSGAGASLESRNTMTRKLIIDSLLHMKNFYKIDGFRFDLMGFTDRETMEIIRARLGHDVILYGEAWRFTDLPSHMAPTKSNLPPKAKLSAFNDTIRDSFAGHKGNSGYVQGQFYELDKVRGSIVGSIKAYKDFSHLVSDDPYDMFADSPRNSLNFLTIHDGFTLWDKINLSVEGTKEDKIKAMKLALAMLFTSQGKIVLHGGVEFARTKPLQVNDPNPDRAHTSDYVIPENGIKFFHENSYNSPDSTNAYDWKRLELFEDVHKYIKDLIQFRKDHPDFRLEDSKDIVKLLKFVSEKDNEPTFDYPSIFKSFQDKKLERLTIKFINAPKEVRGTELFLAGELHAEDHNPKKNKFKVSIDKQGNGKITLSRHDLDMLSLDSWSDPENLQFKLVKEKGKWSAPKGAYTNLGNNTIMPKSIKEDFSSEIDLSVINHRAGHFPIKEDGPIRYELTSKFKTKFDKYLIAINPKDTTMKYKSDCEGRLSLLLDGAGHYPKGKNIRSKTITVRPRSISVIGVNK